MAYTPIEQEFMIDVSIFQNYRISYCWFDPRNGIKTNKIYQNNINHIHVKSPVGLDYVLIIMKEKE